MRREIGDELREQGRGVSGALLVTGLALSHTMEMWWHGWQLPVLNLLAFAVVGLAIILAITRYVGFRKRDRGLSGPWRALADFAELLVQSFVTAYAVLLLFGIVDLSSSPYEIARLGLIMVVPVGFGAAMANHVLGGDRADEPFEFPQNLALFALGAIFLAAPVAPTEEIQLISAHAGWWRIAALVVASLLIAHLMLYELDLRGQRQRVARHTRLTTWGSTFIAYLVAFVVSALMLAAFGHFSATPPVVWIQETVVLAFPAVTGGSAAQVVL